MLSCQKEVQIEEQEVPDGLVIMTFQASIEADEPTRAVLASNGRSTEWRAGDEIAVFDNINNTIHKFVAESDGATTSFTGTVNVGATSFVAVYPYTDDTAYDSSSETPISANIPVIQEAVKNSYDPKAALFVATATQDPSGEDKDINQKFTFTPAFALFKVNVDVDEIRAICVENTKIAMSGSVVAKTTGSLANGTAGSVYKWVSLQKEDGTALEQGTYYIVSRFAGSNSLENFKMTYVKSDASSLTRTAASSITSEIFKRKSILDMGGISAFPGSPSLSWYSFYQAGLDVKIGSKTVNRVTEGDAALIQNGSSSDPLNIASTVSTKKGVFFLKTAGGAFTTETANINITQDISILNDGSGIVVFNFSGDKQWNFRGGNAFLKGIYFDTSGRTSGSIFNNNSTTASSDWLVMDGCVMSGVTKSIFQPNGSYLAYLVKNFEIVNCAFGLNITASLSLINLGASTVPDALESVKFSNNLVYVTNGSTRKATILNLPSSGTCSVDMTLSSNVFVNATATLVLRDVHSLTITNNIQYEGNADTNNCRLFEISNTASTVSSEYISLSNNYVIGLSSSNKWTYSNTDTIDNISGVKAVIKKNEITKSNPEDVFSVTPTISAGSVSYTLLPTFAAFGPQPMPSGI